MYLMIRVLLAGILATSCFGLDVDVGSIVITNTSKLRPSPEASQEFGSNVAVFGDVLVVGAEYLDSFTGVYRDTCDA